MQQQVALTMKSTAHVTVTVVLQIHCLCLFLLLKAEVPFAIDCLGVVCLLMQALASQLKTLLVVV